MASRIKEVRAMNEKLALNIELTSLLQENRDVWEEIDRLEQRIHHMQDAASSNEVRIQAVAEKIKRIDDEQDTNNNSDSV